MAFPVVEATNTGSHNSASTSYSAPLPSGINSGDLLVVFVGLYARNSSPNLNTPSGWTSLFSVAGGGNLRRFAAIYRIASGSEGATLSLTTSSACLKASTAYRITGFDGDPQAETATGSSSLPNPPSLSPSWGQGDTLWIAAMAEIIASITPVTAAPSGFGGLIQAVAVDSGLYDNPRVASAHLASATPSLDPGPFSPSYTSWVAATVAIRGAAAGAARQMMHYRRLRV